VSFSTLQRAENSSTEQRQQRRVFREMFQYSSASRKFLNRAGAANDCAARAFQYSSASRKFLKRAASMRSPQYSIGFSTLQRAENSSTCSKCSERECICIVSVLFSEPKIPQR